MKLSAETVHKINTRCKAFCEKLVNGDLGMDSRTDLFLEPGKWPVMKLLYKKMKLLLQKHFFGLNSFF
jgi:hypothetical protein